MSLSDNTYSNLSTAIKGLTLPDVSRPQAEQLVGFVGLQQLQGWFAAARASDNEARVRIHQAILSIKALYYLLETGVREATLPLVAAIVDTHGYQKLRPVMIQAAEGDPNAKAIL